MRLRWWVLTSITLAGVSLGGELYLITQVPPDPVTLFAGPQLLFLLLMFLTLGATTVPISAYLNYRFAKPGWMQRDKIRMVRQGSWVGLLGVMLAYLQLIRALTPVIATALTTVFVFIELFFLTRD